jgi:hypothetical protein
MKIYIYCIAGQKMVEKPPGCGTFVQCLRVGDSNRPSLLYLMATCHRLISLDTRGMAGTEWLAAAKMKRQKPPGWFGEKERVKRYQSRLRRWAGEGGGGVGIRTTSPLHHYLLYTLHSPLFGLFMKGTQYQIRQGSNPVPIRTDLHLPSI